jgi:arabinosaccharide transport system substrate-binding protein
MKKIIGLAVCLLSAVSLFSGGQQDPEEGTPVSFWTFQELHVQFYEAAAERWNAEFPDRKIALDAQAYPYDDMHNKLLIALQSGTGAPDMVDIELGKFPNYLKGVPQLVPMNDYVEPVKSQFIESRFNIYAKDGKYYGIPFHVGASVIYYNTEILDQAGVDPYAIETWDDFVEAGKKVRAVTGKPMTTIEPNDIWSVWPLLSQAGGDFFDEQGKCVIDNARNTQTIQFMYDMIFKNKVAEVAPGFHHSEEYYGFMNDGGAASVWMPMWYMGRFTDYMPDLKGKILIRPMPVWSDGKGFRSAGMGGTGTCVTNQSENIDLVKEFLAYAKLSKEGNILFWEMMGFDPPRWDVWKDPRMNAPNKFTEYFENDDIFGMLLDVKDSMNDVRVTEKLPLVHDLVKTSLSPKLFINGTGQDDVHQVLAGIADEVNK